MSNGKSDLFVYLGASFATLIGLAVLQKGYSGYIDVRYHQRLAEAGPAENAVAARQEDQAALQKGKLPLDQAIARLGQRGRTGLNAVAPAPSSDLSAISGWIHHPSFKPAVAHPIRTARAPVAPAAAPVAEAAPAPTPDAPAAQPAAAPAAAEPATPAEPTTTPANGKVAKPAARAKKGR